MRKIRLSHYIVISTLILSALTTQDAQALTGLPKPFGGRVITNIPCTCAAGTMSLITIGTPTPMTLIWTVGSKPYPFYYPSVGRHILGVASPTSAQCYVGAPPYCTTVGSGKVITFFGTSK